MLPSSNSRYNALKQIGNRIIPVEEAEHILVIEERVKGYKVKVQYQALDEEDKKARREAVAQVILQSLRRQKGSEWEAFSPFRLDNKISAL